MYDLLEWVETERKDHITLFWKCAFNPSIMNHYPKLQMMYNNLMDGQWRFFPPLPPDIYQLIDWSVCCITNYFFGVAKTLRCAQTRIKK